MLVDGGRITAVLDWGCSLYGDFLYELAWMQFWLPWYPAMVKADVVGAINCGMASPAARNGGANASSSSSGTSGTMAPTAPASRASRAKRSAP